MNIGEKIKEYRIKKGMTQGELAKAIISTPAAISRYELGQREARYSVLRAIAIALDAPETEFLDEYPREPLKVNDYQKRLSDIEDMLDNAMKEKPSEQTGTMRQIHSALTQLLCEERFSLGISESYKKGENQNEGARVPQIKELTAAFDKLSDEGRMELIKRAEELTYLPMYKF